MKSSNRANYYYMWCSHKSRSKPLWESPAHYFLPHASISQSFWALVAIPGVQTVELISIQQLQQDIKSVPATNMFVLSPPVPESVPSLTSAPVLPLSAARLASPLGAASSPAAAAAAGAAAKATPPTGATAAAHPGTPSLVPAAAVGVGARWANATGPGTSLLCQYYQPEPPLLFPAERGDGVGAVVWAPLCAHLWRMRENIPVGLLIPSCLYSHNCRLNVFCSLLSLVKTYIANYNQKTNPEMQLASLLTK